MSLLNLLTIPKTTNQLHEEYNQYSPMSTKTDVYNQLQMYYNMGLLMKHKKGVNGEVTWEKIKKDLQFDYKSL